MTYRDQFASHCKRCGKPREDGEQFSVRGRCLDCGIGVALTEMAEMHHRTGPWFQHWRHRTAASVGAVILDEPRPPSDTEPP